ncbi:hypothetical protein DFA_02463 [Cavenderia fasciculata]|uniref:Condensin complex subunit 2 n=1 Tax=Cavenderia fasciculata TaxID=261658 RepID=F4PZI6_CACFS|nr:uncharacterized protein DFA_02463 [Cavenderia fasciculata]EGG19215.1 hypothetical protein DFA_02463 [Cavenderia fasciculata]|eukprot:XP_004366848.1 hypothetical protein DFA_02463 [Cavenderia fasciculata]
MITKRRLSVGFALKDSNNNNTKSGANNIELDNEDFEDEDTDKVVVNNNNNNKKKQSSSSSTTATKKKDYSSEEEEDDGNNTDEEEDNIESSNNNNNIRNVKQQLSAIPKSKRKSILPPRTSSSLTNNNNNNNNNNISLNGPQIPSTPSTTKSLLSNQQISEIYSNCIKLSTENKINQKNTWGLKLIDHIDDVIQNQTINNRDGEEGETNFQKVSGMLDATIKIYSSRVDSVMTDTYRMWGEMTRSRKDMPPNEDGEDGEGQSKDDQEEELDEEGNPIAKTKDKKKKKSGASTLESNINNINCKKFDVTFMTDPLFHKTSAAFDAGGVAGLLMNKLSVNSHYKIIFDSSDSHNQPQDNGSLKEEEQEVEEMPNTKIVNLQPFNNIFSIIKKLNTPALCPQFNSFIQFKHFDQDINNNNNQNQNQNNGIKKIETKMTEEEELAAMLDNEMAGGEIDLDAEEKFAVAAAAQDGHFDDHFDHLDDDDINDQIGGGGIGGDDFVPNDPIFSNLNQDSINKMGMDDDDEKKNGTEYGEMGVGIVDDQDDWDDVLEGPMRNLNATKSWRLRSRPSIGGNNNNTNNNAIDDGGLESGGTGDKKKKTTKKKKSNTFIDFDAPPPPNSMFEPPKGKNSTVLTDAMLRKAGGSTTTMAPDIQYDIKQLCRLFNKPKWIIPPLSRRDEFLASLYPPNQKEKERERDREHHNEDGEDGQDNVGGVDDGDEDDFDNDQMGGGFGGESDFLSSQMLNDNTINGSADNVGGVYDDLGDWGDSSGVGNGIGGSVSDMIANNGVSATGMSIGAFGGQYSLDPNNNNNTRLASGITYARGPKSINVKFLKQTLWNLIEKNKKKEATAQQEQEQEILENNQLEDNDIESSQTNQETESTTSTTTTTDTCKFTNNFSNLVDDLRGVRQDVPISMAFIFVLHLANEHNLVLDQNDKMDSNFKIKVPNGINNNNNEDNNNNNNSHHDDDNQSISSLIQNNNNNNNNSQSKESIDDKNNSINSSSSEEEEETKSKQKKNTKSSSTKKAPPPKSKPSAKRAPAKKNNKMDISDDDEEDEDSSQDDNSSSEEDSDSDSSQDFSNSEEEEEKPKKKAPPLKSNSKPPQVKPLANNKKK